MSIKELISRIKVFCEKDRKSGRVVTYWDQLIEDFPASDGCPKGGRYFFGIMLFVDARVFVRRTTAPFDYCGVCGDFVDVEFVKIRNRRKSVYLPVCKDCDAYKAILDEESEFIYQLSYALANLEYGEEL